jgi:hypothetical protein
MSRCPAARQLKLRTNAFADNPLNRPQQITRSYRSQNRNPVAPRENNLVQMLDLQAVVERVSKAMSEMKQRQRAHHEQIEPCDRRMDQLMHGQIAGSMKPPERRCQTKKEQLHG